jgi:hypothetical protein
MNTLQQNPYRYLSYQKKLLRLETVSNTFDHPVFVDPGNDCSLLSQSQDCWCLYQSAVIGKMQKDKMEFNCLCNADPNVTVQLP